MTADEARRLFRPKDEVTLERLFEAIKEESQAGNVRIGLEDYVFDDRATYHQKLRDLGYEVNEPSYCHVPGFPAGYLPGTVGWLKKEET